MPACVNCSNFKMLKGWKKAKCMLGNLGNDTERKFEWESKREKARNKNFVYKFQHNLITRSKKMQVLNPDKCGMYESLV